MDTVQKVEQVKHLPIKFGEVARYVIVPGDPNRVPLIEVFRQSNSSRAEKRI